MRRKILTGIAWFAMLVLVYCVYAETKSISLTAFCTAVFAIVEMNSFRISNLFRTVRLLSNDSIGDAAHQIGASMGAALIEKFQVPEAKVGIRDVSIFQKVYDSEINFIISTCWDAGFYVKIRDSKTGDDYEEVLVEKWDEVAGCLQNLVMKYPDSNI